MQRTLSMVGLLVVFLSCVSCTMYDRRQAERSLQGIWNVNFIFSDEKDRTGPNRDGHHKESGQLGTFSFSGNQVVYSYTRLGTIYTDTSPWTLTGERVRDSFFTSIRYTLTLKDRAYDVQYGDQTSDAEHDAKNVELRLIPDSNQRPYHILSLSKQ